MIQVKRLREEQLSTKLIQFGLPLVLLLVLVAFLTSISGQLNKPEMEWAVTIDFLITAPLAHWLLIRKNKGSKFTVFPFFMLGLVLAHIFLPEGNRSSLSKFTTYVLPAIELFVFIVIFKKVLVFRNHFKKAKGKELRFYDALLESCREILPSRISHVFATEIAVIYFTFFAWKKTRYGLNEFSYHKKAGAQAVLGILVFAICVETFALHLLLQRWNLIVAWIFTGLSIYTMFQVIGILKSISRIPISVHEEGLALRYGIIADAFIPFDQIEDYELVSRALQFDDATRHISPLKELEKYNIVFNLKQEVTIHGIYGIKKHATRIACQVDDLHEFLTRVESLKQKSPPENS
jgi:hypothetical protein